MFDSLSSLFGGSRDQMDIYNPIKNDTKPYYDPYINAGTDSLGSLQEQLKRMYSDPAALFNDLGKGYRESPGYQHNVQSATQAANRAAAAGGQLGSTGEQQALGEQISGMADQDYENYINHVLGLYGQGVQGLGDLSHQGYQASSSFADMLANARLGQAGVQMQAQQSQDAGLSGLLSALGMASGSFMGM